MTTRKDMVSGEIALLDADATIHYMEVCDQVINKILDSAIKRADAATGVVPVMDSSLETVRLAYSILRRILIGQVTDKDVEQLDKWDAKYLD